jgi:hypothetical protein
LGPLRPRFMRSQCNAPTVQVFPTRAGTDTSPRHLVCMKKIEDYRAHSDECRRARSPEDKAMFMNMPATWESLCVDRQAHIERRARIAKLEEGAAAVPTVLLSCSIW